VTDSIAPNLERAIRCKELVGHGIAPFVQFSRAYLNLLDFA
jgi:hypothetical protein